MRELVLHLMVLVVFVEGVKSGPVSIGRVLAVVSVFAVALAIAARPQSRMLPHPRVAVPAALLAIWTALSSLWSESAVGWSSALLQLALALSFFVGYAVLLESRAQVRRLLRTFVVGALVVTVVGVMQGLQGERAVGLQGDPNTYALYSLAAVPIAVLLARRSAGGARLIWFVAAAFLISAVISAQSRGALLAAVATALYLLWRGDLGGTFERNRRAWTVFGGLTVAGAVAVAVRTIPRFAPETVAAGGGTGRVDIWRAAYSAWGEHPILGLGAGNFEAQSGQLLSQTPGVQLNPRSLLFEGIRVHNSYLEPLVELGPLGFFLVTALLVGSWTLLARNRAAPHDLINACQPMLVGFATSAMFISSTTNKLLWLLIGIAGALPYLPEEDPPRRAGLDSAATRTHAGAEVEVT